MSYPPPPPPQGQYGYGPPQNHKNATLALVLGIISLVICGFVGPFAWVIGKRAMDEIDSSGGQLGGRGMAQAGYILGLVATVLLAIGIVVIIIIVAVTASSGTS